MRLRLAGFSAMLLITMSMSTLTFFQLAVAASELQRDLGIGKLELGLLAAANTGAGGLFAPIAGRVSDQLGSRRAMACVLIISGTTAALLAGSPTFATLLASSGLAGIAQGLSNPATNRAIAYGIPPQQRGIVTGIKQSGVQLAVFTAGFTMPWIIDSYSWRSGLLVTSVVSALALFGLPLITELDSEQHITSRTGALQTKRPLPVFVTQVAIFGLLFGSIGGGLGRFLPLFAEEQVGFSPEAAGRVFGVQGLVSIPVRILSGILLDRGVSPRRTLTVMGLGGAASIGLILAASSGSSGFLWAGTILGGLTLGSWNTAAQLTMIRQKQDSGRASGRLMAGFLMGLTIGAPIVGWTIDTFGYTPAWIASAVVALLGAAIVTMRLSDTVR